MCAIGCLLFGFPRAAILLLVLFGDYIGNAYQTTIWPLLGFFVAPYTTLAYAFTIHQNGGVGGIYLILLGVAAALDLGLIGSGARGAKQQREVRSVGRKQVKNEAE